MDDVRWFAPNAYAAVVVPELRRLGLAVATDGDRPVLATFAEDVPNGSLLK